MLTKKPHKSPTKETKAQKFIRAGSAAPAAAGPDENGRRRGELKPIVINFPGSILERLDQAAASMGLTRTAFVMAAVSERIMRLDRGE